MWGKIALVGLVLFFAPVWRGAGHSRHDGVTFPRLLYDSTKYAGVSPFGHPHMQYEEAVSQAREAYLQHCAEQEYGG